MFTERKVGGKEEEEGKGRKWSLGGEKNSSWKQRTQDRILSLHLNNFIRVKKPLASPEDCFSLMSC